jgi:oligosaccharide repeat unit polymerase
MPYFICLLSLGLIFFFRKLFSKYYFTPTGFLTVTWIVFVGLKLLFVRDYYFSTGAAVLIVVFIFSFFLGEFLMFCYVSLRPDSIVQKFINQVDIELDMRVFNNKTISKLFDMVLLLIGFLSLMGSVLYVYSFVGYFGSVLNVLTAGWALRGALEEISIPLFTRAILMLGYSSIILTLVYLIIYNKFKWYFSFSYISLLILGITQAGRAGFMMILFQIFIASFWREIFRNLINKNSSSSFLNSPEYKLVKSSLRLVSFVGVIFVGGDMLRSQNFSFDSEIIGQGLSSFKVYLFGGIAAFTTYLNDYKFGELGWGRYSFSSLYDLLGIHKNTIGIYTDYLRISSVDVTSDTNIFTAFRQFMDDFGIFGTIILMFFFGTICFVFFRKAIKGDVASIAFMIVFYTFIFHTPLLSITVHNSVLISAILPYFIIKKLRKIKLKP